MGGTTGGMSTNFDNLGWVYWISTEDFTFAYAGIRISNWITTDYGGVFMAFPEWGANAMALHQGDVGSTVPEPTSVALLGAGEAIGLGATHERRTHNAPRII